VGAFSCSSDDAGKPVSNEGGAGTGGAGTGGASQGGASSGGATATGGASSATGGATSSGGGKATTGPITPPCSVCADTISACTRTPPSAGTGRAAQVAAKLGKSHFVIGMGNDLDNDHSKDGAYTLGTKLDLHYAYMVGLPGIGPGGWPDWNANGTFANILSDSAARNCVTPMYTVYSMAAEGDGNLAGLANDGYMRAYWNTAKLLFERIAAFGKPAVVHLEPDFFAYAQIQSNGQPESRAVRIHGLAPDCDGDPENLVGMGRCWVTLARKYAPKALVGFHVSQWGGSPPDLVRFFNAIGAADTDLIFMDMLDRDAGCFEAGNDPNCTRQGEFYWDETNQKSPNFHEYLAYAKQISDGLNKPILWWQVPFGVPSDTPGGTPGHYRDNRVKYIFSHIDEFIAAGGLGVTFGVGAGNQTDWKTDNGQFKNAVSAYFQNPVRLP
jgi:hypothetical protein